MTALHSGNFILNGVVVLGPDAIVYQEKPVVGLRMDGVPQKQGYNAMEWRYATVPGDEMKLLQTAWVTTYGQGLDVTFINKLGAVENGRYYMQQPVIGKRRMFVYDGVVIRFTATYREGMAVAYSPLTAGSSAGFDRFLNGELYVQGIESEELFGVLSLTILPFDIHPTSIASGEAFGTLHVRRNIVINGIASLESIGSLSVIRVIKPSSITTLEAFGTLAATLRTQIIVPTAIASLESFGSLTLTRYLQDILPTAIASSEAFGTLHIKRYILPTAIASAEAFGTLQVVRNVARSADGASISTSDPIFGGNGPSNAIDGNDTTVWNGATTSTVTGVVDMGSSRTISRFRVLQNNLGHRRHFIISSSPDNSTWTQRYTSGSGALPAVDTKLDLTTSATTRYWRIELIGPSENASFGSALYTLELYGF